MHVHVDELAKFADQVLDMDAGATVDIGRKLSGQDRGMHAGESTQPDRQPPDESAAAGARASFHRLPRAKASRRG